MRDWIQECWLATQRAERAEAALAARDCGHDRADSMVQKEFARLRRELAEARRVLSEVKAKLDNLPGITFSQLALLNVEAWKLIHFYERSLAARPAPADYCGHTMHPCAHDANPRPAPSGPEPFEVDRPAPQCSFYDCHAAPRFSGMCEVHYWQMTKRGGEP